MKLEEKFFNTFFYPFLISVILSTIIVTLFVGIFTNNSIDKRTNSNIINFASKLSKINIKSANSLVSTILLKIQASLNEHILYYQRISKKIIETGISKLILHSELFKCVFDYNESYLEEQKQNLKYMAFWYSINNISTYDDMNDNSTKKQIISFSNIMHNLYSTFEAFPKDNSVYVYYFFFEKTDLFITYPMSYHEENGYLGVYTNYEGNPYWCINEEGNI